MQKTPLSIDDLKARIRRCEGGFGDPELRRHVPTRLGALDRRLGGGGLPAGALTALVTPGRAAELAWTCAVLIAAAIVRAAAPPLGGEAVLVETGSRAQREDALYPPGVAELGLGFERTLFVRPARARDGPWALEEALRSPAVAVAIGALRRPAAPEVRRLELAVEAGGGVGLVLAREAEMGALAHAPVVLRVRPRAATDREDAPISFGVEVVRSKGTWVEAGREIVVHVGAKGAVSHVSGAEDGPPGAERARASA
jgi:hypothetical protein